MYECIDALRVAARGDEWLVVVQSGTKIAPALVVAVQQMDLISLVTNFLIIVSGYVCLRRRSSAHRVADGLVATRRRQRQRPWQSRGPVEEAMMRKG